MSQMTAYEKRKEELLEKTLLLKPLTEMELTDTNDVSNIEVTWRSLNCVVLILFFSFLFFFFFFGGGGGMCA